MSFFQHFDEDKLLRHVLPLISNALDAWERGMNADEGALMNQVTSALNTRRGRRCEVGLDGTYRLHAELFDLHRQGPQQTDLYGSDLAVTVRSDTAPVFVKTAFFQFKIAHSHQTIIEARQVQDASVHIPVLDRSFCIAADPNHRTIRVESLVALKSTFPPQNLTQTVTTHNWSRFAEWLLAWLRCTVGPWSSAADKKSIEELLRDFTLPDPAAAALTRNLPRNYSPARAWLLTTFELEEAAT